MGQRKRESEQGASLFGERGRDEAAAPVPPSGPLPPPRLRRADRAQVLLRPCSLEDLIGPDHPARVVWALVSRWDMSAFEAAIRARGEAPGRGATDPRTLCALWLYGYTQGVGGGRELARLCGRDDAYRWLCGGVGMNYHTLNDFRVDHEAAVDELLTRMVAALLSQDLVSVTRISQDGTRVRAGAGRNSFKTRDALQRHLAAAREHVEAMKRQAQDPSMPARRAKAAERAARDRAERLERALAEVAKVEAAKAAQKDKPSKRRPARASATDPEARQMRMADGGTRPAYNVQFAVATDGRAIVGVDVTNTGSDANESAPMRQQVERRAGGGGGGGGDRMVAEHLVDGGYVGLASIEAAEPGVTIYAPVPKPRKAGVDPHAPKAGDGPQVAAWRKRMATPEAKAIYQERASTVETVNGECKTCRGLTQVLVRGIAKVRCVALWSALAYNVVHFGRHLLPPPA